MEGRIAMDNAEPLLQAIEVIARAVAPTGAQWLIGGSTGLLLRGLELTVPPRDLDLYADDEAAGIMHEALRAYAVDEPQLSVSPIYRSVLSHYNVSGVQVELVGGFVVSSGLNRYAVEVEDVLNPLRTPVAAGPYTVGVAPLAHELWFNVLRARDDRVAPIAARMRKEHGLHTDALRLIASRNRLSAEMQQHVSQLLR